MHFRIRTDWTRASRKARINPPSLLLRRIAFTGIAARLFVWRARAGSESVSRAAPSPVRRSRRPSRRIIARPSIPCNFGKLCSFGPGPLAFIGLQFCGHYVRFGLKYGKSPTIHLADHATLDTDRTPAALIYIGEPNARGLDSNHLAATTIKLRTAARSSRPYNHRTPKRQDRRLNRRLRANSSFSPRQHQPTKSIYAAAKSATHPGKSEYAPAPAGLRTTHPSRTNNIHSPEREVLPRAVSNGLRLNLSSPRFSAHLPLGPARPICARPG